MSESEGEKSFYELKWSNAIFISARITKNSLIIQLNAMYQSFSSLFGHDNKTNGTLRHNENH